MLAEQIGASARVCAAPPAQEPIDPIDPRHLPDAERYRRFGEEIDALKERTVARVGQEDVAYVRRMNRFSRAMEVVGRVLIHFSLEPISFLAGVGALWIHKQLQATEIGHTALHGAYDQLPGAERFSSKAFRWDMPIDEESWRYGHNVRHHGNTNIAGRDPGHPLRPGPPHRADALAPAPRDAAALHARVLFPNFTFFMICTSPASTTSTSTTACRTSSTSCPIARRRASRRRVAQGRCASTCPTT